MNGSNSKVESDARKESEHHHHHKKNRGTSSDEKKIRDKKKRKKSKEHEKKKSKKDRKDRDKEKEKKSSSKTGSVDKTPEAPAEIAEEAEKTVDLEEKSVAVEPSTLDHGASFNERNLTPDRDEPLKTGFKRSDSFLDINPNVDLDFDEWIAPEVSKWERDENKSIPSMDNSEQDIGNGDLKKNAEEKVTTEILKRAENAIFARAISAIRPVENKKVKTVQDQDSSYKRSTSPIVSSSKRTESSKDSSKIQAFQVTVPTNESGSRSVELKSTEKPRKSPLKTSIKNRLGVKVVEKRSRTPSRSPKRRLQSEGTKVVRSSRDHGGRSQQNVERSGRDRHQTPENRRNKPQSSCVKVSGDSRETRDARRGSSRNRPADKRRSLTPVDRRAPPKRARSHRSRSNSRHRRPARKPSPERHPARSRETRNDDRPARPVERSPSDNEKSKTKHVEAVVEKKKPRDSSSSSSASSTSGGSQKHSKRHAKQKSKKRSRSPSADSSRRKKSKKEKKSKKKKKSSRKWGAKVVDFENKNEIEKL